MGRPGTFQKGHAPLKGCGAPKGHKRVSPESGREWALKHLDRVNGHLLALLDRPDTSPTDIIRIATILHDRAWGKPIQQIEGVPGGQPITLAVQEWPKSLLEAAQRRLEQALKAAK